MTIRIETAANRITPVSLGAVRAETSTPASRRPGRNRRGRHHRRMWSTQWTASSNGSDLPKRAFPLSYPHEPKPTRSLGTN